jgi:chromosomal replication initiation ATPase DnaA
MIQSKEEIVRIIPTQKDVDWIIEKVCDAFDMPVSLVKTKLRKQEYIRVRRLLCWYLYQCTELDLVVIGETLGYLGKQIHTTVIHHRDTVDDFCKTNRPYRENKERLDEIIFENFPPLEIKLKENRGLVRHLNKSRFKWVNR